MITESLPSQSSSKQHTYLNTYIPFNDAGKKSKKIGADIGWGPFRFNAESLARTATAKACCQLNLKRNSEKLLET